MPQLHSVKPASFSDSATLRRASSDGTYKGSTTGSFIDVPGFGSFAPSSTGGGSYTDAPMPTESLLEESDAIGLPMGHGAARYCYLMQYFAVGFVYGGLPATTYGFFKGYLGVPAFVYATVNTVMTMPWSFKFVLGAWNDCVPIFGLRRKPYMVIGWAACTAMLIGLYLVPLPPPFYCQDPQTGALLVDEPPCHPESAEQGGLFTLLMTGACLGYVVADGLAIWGSNPRGEDPLAKTHSVGPHLRYSGRRRAHRAVRARRARGAARVHADHRLPDARTRADRGVQPRHDDPRLKPHELADAHRICPSLTRSRGPRLVTVGFGMNGKQYLGSFDVSLSFSQVPPALAQSPPELPLSSP